MFRDTDQYSPRGQLCSRGPSRPNFYGLVLETYSLRLGLGGPGRGLGHGLESCIDNIFGMTLKL